MLVVTVPRIGPAAVFQCSVIDWPALKPFSVVVTVVPVTPLAGASFSPAVTVNVALAVWPLV